MDFYRTVERLVLRFINFLWYVFVNIHEKKNIIHKKNMYIKQDLTDDQKKQIDLFYKENYGKKISYKWHRLYQSYSGKFDYQYLPEYIFTTKLEPINNKRLQVLPFENKAMLSNFIRGMGDCVRIPETYVSCIDGCFYDGKGSIISFENTVKLLKQMNNGVYQAICKKTIDTSSGRDVRLISLNDGFDILTNESIESILLNMGNHYIIQEKIVAHPSFAALYSEAINTLRIVTYQTSNDYKVAPVIMRIGRNGYVDNAHAGGMFIGVTNDGALLKEAYTEYQECFERHPISGVKFEGYTLPRVSDAIEIAIRLHKNYPTMKYISWDFTVDQNEDIVLIEANLHSQTIWFSQIAHGKGFFGEDTAEMLRMIAKK